MTYPPAIEVEALPNWMLKVKFSNNVTKLYDAKQLLDDGPIGEHGIDYRKLKDESLFNTVRLDPIEEGWHLTWDEEIELNIGDVWHNGTPVQ
jgi:hypothetical protein